VAIGARSCLSRKGCVFLYNLGTGDTQVFKGEERDDEFGTSVSLSADGSTLAAGAPFAKNGKGSVRVFRDKSRNGRWDEVGHPIVGEDQGDESSISISLSNEGDRLAIGALRAEKNGQDEKGHVRLYELHGNDWEKIGDDIDAMGEKDFLGCSVSLAGDGTIVAIGARQNGDEMKGENSGYTQVWKISDDHEWTQLGGTITGLNDADEYGDSVSISGDGKYLAIGAAKHDCDRSVENCGRVQLFQIRNEEWDQIGGDIDGEMANEGVGRSVSLSRDGSTLAIGATLKSDLCETPSACTGYVIVYNLLDGELRRVYESSSRDGAFGSSVALSGDGGKLVVGAELVSDKGGAYLLQKNGCLQFEVKIDFDGFADEISWVLVDESSDKVAGRFYDDSYNSGTDSFRKCLPPGMYTWTLSDSMNDGLCSTGVLCGGYSVEYDGVAVGIGNVFKDSVIVPFGRAPTAPCGSGENPLDLKIFLDDYPTETSWNLTNECTGEVVRSGGEYSTSDLIETSACVPRAKYAFAIFDSMGDGICCKFGKGAYEINYDAKEIVVGGNFDLEEHVSFGECPTELAEGFDSNGENNFAGNYYPSKEKLESYIEREDWSSAQELVKNPGSFGEGIELLTTADSSRLKEYLENGEMREVEKELEHMRDEVEENLTNLNAEDDRSEVEFSYNMLDFFDFMRREVPTNTKMQASGDGWTK